MTPQGLTAYRTYLGMSLHFRRGSYDGWQYNFNGKVNPDTYEANRAIVHRYASLESRYPTKNDQIKFFYPAFSKGFMKANDISGFTKSYQQFNNMFEDLWYMQYGIELKQLGSYVSSIDELMGVANSLPTLYNAYIEEVVSYNSLILLSLAIPSINSLVSEEPFLWNSLNEKLKFDSKFYKLYLDETKTLKELKTNTIAILSDAWKLKR